MLTIPYTSCIYEARMCHTKRTLQVPFMVKIKQKKSLYLFRVPRFLKKTEAFNTKLKKMRIAIRKYILIFQSPKEKVERIDFLYVHDLVCHQRYADRFFTGSIHGTIRVQHQREKGGTHCRYLIPTTPYRALRKHIPHPKNIFPSSIRRSALRR